MGNRIIKLKVAIHANVFFKIVAKLALESILLNIKKNCNVSLLHVCMHSHMC